MLGKSSSSKWLIIVCVVSVVLNIVLLGYLLGKGFSGHRHGDKHSKFERKMHRMVKDLPESKQEKFMATIKGYAPDLEQDMRLNLRDLNFRLVATIGAEELDEEAVRQLFAEIRGTFDNAHMKFQEGFIEALQDLSLEDRKKVAEAFEKRKRYGKDK